MVLPIIGAGIGAIGSVLGAKIQSDAQEDIAARNIAMQREFAQNAIQWKVADAGKAGIHPLFALGAQTSSFSNVAGGEGIGSGLAQAGQDLGRAVSATGDQEAKALTLTAARLDVERKGLENDVLRAELASQVRKVTQPGTLAAGIPFPPARPEIDADKIIPTFRMMGKDLINPGMTSDVGSTLTNIFGEGAEYILGVPKAMEVLGVNAIRNILRLRDPALAAQFERYLARRFPMKQKGGG